MTYAKSYVRGANNNPTNIKAGQLTRKWVNSGKATLDPVEAGDGGHYLRFNNLSDGIAAAKDLLLTGPYKDLPVGTALRKWSDGAYDAINLGLPKINFKKVSELGDTDLTDLVGKMAHYESGYSISPARSATTTKVASARLSPRSTASKR